MIDKMAEKMAQASASRMAPPKKGERFRCQKCGMEIQVTTECKCVAPEHAQFECCGQAMAKILA
jgi:hypothetical protein